MSLPLAEEELWPGRTNASRQVLVSSRRSSCWGVPVWPRRSPTPAVRVAPTREQLGSRLGRFAPRTRRGSRQPRRRQRKPPRGRQRQRPSNESLGPDSDDPARTRVGSGRGDIQDLSPGNRSEPSDRTGSDVSGAPSAKFEPPKVTVGNGRSPGVQDNDREPRSRIPAPEPAPPPPPPPPAPAPSPSWVDRVYTPPTMPRQLGVAPASKLTDPLWGIAGLLLIPAAGAVLGYRQARAAQGAEKLRRP
jgi:hypothetical protein